MTGASVRVPIGRRVSVETLVDQIKESGFQWEQLRDYFPFTDGHWREGEYMRLLDACLQSLATDEARQDLLNCLDLQYMVLLEQFAIQEKNLPHLDEDSGGVGFGERVMAYLALNSTARPGRSVPSGRTILFDTPPGQLINRLYGQASTERPASAEPHDQT